MLNRYSLKATQSPFVQSWNTPITWGRYVSTRDNTTLDIEPTPGDAKFTPSMTNGNGFGIFFGRVGNTTSTTTILRNDGKILIGNVMFWLYLVSRPVLHRPLRNKYQLILTYAAALNSLSSCMRNMRNAQHENKS